MKVTFRLCFNNYLGVIKVLVKFFENIHHDFEIH